MIGKTEFYQLNFKAISRGDDTFGDRDVERKLKGKIMKTKGEKWKIMGKHEVVEVPRPQFDLPENQINFNTDLNVRKA